MNIKEHIEAGHYPADTGVTTVATRGGRIAYVYTTKHHPDWPIVGGIEGETEPRAWMPDGRIATSRVDEDDLLPPSPRKVKVRCKLRHNGHDFVIWDLEGLPQSGWRDGAEIEFTTEYEEPWS